MCRGSTCPGIIEELIIVGYGSIVRFKEMVSLVRFAGGPLIAGPKYKIKL